MWVKGLKIEPISENVQSDEKKQPTDLVSVTLEFFSSSWNPLKMWLQSLTL